MKSEKLCIDVVDLTWEIFEERFKKKFLSPKYYKDCIDEFNQIKQWNMSVDQYEKRFLGLR